MRRRLAQIADDRPLSACPALDTPAGSARAIDADDGSVLGWNPGLTWPARPARFSSTAMRSSSATFTSAGGETRSNLAAVDLRPASSPAGRPSWQRTRLPLPRPRGRGGGGGTAVYLGGRFGAVDGEPRRTSRRSTSRPAICWRGHPASLRPLSPSPSGHLDEVDPVTHTIYVGGFFTETSGGARSSLAAFDRLDPYALHRRTHERRVADLELDERKALCRRGISRRSEGRQAHRGWPSSTPRPERSIRIVDSRCRRVSKCMHTLTLDDSSLYVGGGIE